MPADLRSATKTEAGVSVTFPGPISGELPEQAARKAAPASTGRITQDRLIIVPLIWPLTAYRIRVGVICPTR